MSSDLKGNILCFPDTDENFPETWTQRSNRFAQIITDAATNPFFQKMLDSPGNLKLCQTMSGFKELVLPQLVSWEQQMGEIAILLDGKPVPNPDIVDIDNQIAKLQAGMAQLNEAAAPALPMMGSAMPAPRSTAARTGRSGTGNRTAYTSKGRAATDGVFVSD